MRKISPFEFVRRFHHGVTNHDGRYVWFLGAGCSVSSGIGDAADTSLRWLRELKYLETGTSDDVEQWAPNRFANYRSEDSAALYGDTLSALFYTEQEQERELERINAAAEPGFGYATLAQLVTQPDWGERCNTMVTTNFDDLAADALYLYSQRKPQVLTHESFDRRIRISTSRPTILKIYGDAHLGGHRDEPTAKLLRSDVKDRLRAQFTEAALVFVGYGGRDESVADLLSGLPFGAPAGGIYWVNDEEPREPIRTWLEERNTIWTPYSDFEGLMFLMRQEFALGHPRIDRFDKILRRYDEQYRSLAARDDLRPEGEKPAPHTPSSLTASTIDGQSADATAFASSPSSPSPEAQIETDTLETTEDAPWHATLSDPFDRHDVISEDEVWADDDPAESITPDTTEDEVISQAVENRNDDDDDASRTRIDRLIAAAVAAMATDQRQSEETDTTPSPPAPAGRPNLALVTTQTISPGDYSGEDIAAAPQEAEAQLEQSSAGITAKGGSSHSDQDTDVSAEKSDNVEVIAEAADTQLETRKTPIDYARYSESLELPRRLLGRADATELDRRYLAAIQDSPNNPKLLSRYARFLTIGRRDHDGAEHYFNRAIDADPQDSEVLRYFAQFLTRVRRDADRAEDCYRLALRVDFEDTETLCSYADFLWKVRGDNQAAGECFQLAVDGSPRHAQAIAAYAEFLRVVEQKDDAAFALLKLATASTKTDPAPAVKLAQFVAEKRGDLNKAEAIFSQAIDIAPDSAETIAAAATFLANSANKVDEAENLFNQAIAVDADAPEILRAFAEFQCIHRKDHDSAEALLQRAINADPGDAKTALAFAQFQEEERRDLNAADEYYRRAVHLDPRDADVLASHARFLHKTRNNPAAAEERYRKALSLDPKNGFALAHFGNFLLHERNDMDAAEPLLQRAVEVAPRNAAALADLGLILRERGEGESSEKMFRRAVAADPRRVATLRRYARVVNSAQTNPAATQAFYDKALAENPEDPATLCGAAQAMFSLGKRSEGLSLLDRAFEAALDDEPSKRDPDLLLELWFYRYAFDDRAGRDAIKAALWLVRAGARATRNDLDAVMKFAVIEGHREPDLLSELASVACGEAEPEQLQRFNVA